MDHRARQGIDNGSTTQELGDPSGCLNKTEIIKLDCAVSWDVGVTVITHLGCLECGAPSTYFPVIVVIRTLLIGVRTDLENKDFSGLEGSQESLCWPPASLRQK